MVSIKIDWCTTYAVFALTYLPEARDRKNWIQTNENYERIYLNKYIFFLNLAFGQVGEKIRQRPSMCVVLIF